ncbi:MAG TPA: hypothetical protein VL053_11195 [Arachidicoccus sp.]|nr:hypothetical protein [Arachidicoccus sp.]
MGRTFEHFNPHFITTVLFLPNSSDTQIEWTLLFEAIEMREIIVKAHRAGERQVQNMERLEKYLSGLNDKFV